MFVDALGSTRPSPRPEKPYLYAIGDIVDDFYFVRSYLGQGGMGAVLRVQDQMTGEICALKYCEHARYRKRFAREVRIMISVESDHVMRISSSNLDHDPPYFIMPFADCSLESKLPSLKRNETAVLDTMHDICLGVRDLHSNGIFHRDLKPANILYLTDGRV